jgi:hypothetical protein
MKYFGSLGYIKLYYNYGEDVKNKVLGLLLIACVGAISANDTQLALSICAGADLSMKNEKDGRLVSEKEMRGRLYWQDAYNPHYYLLKDFPFDYYIAILSDHITYLENQISLQKSGFTSNAMLEGVICGSSSVLMGYLTYIMHLRALADQQHIYSDSIIPLTCSTQRFHKASYYAERLIQRLERDKRILATLEKGKASLIAKARA